MRGNKILVMGLPGAGKTTLADKLAKRIGAVRLNADVVREKENDWDFSEEGRKRQSKRMCEKANEIIRHAHTCVADFVCPLPENRKDFDADYIVWVDTIKEGRFEDTNKMFVPPEDYFIKVTEMDSDKWANIIAERIGYD